VGFCDRGEDVGTWLDEWYVRTTSCDLVLGYFEIDLDVAIFKFKYKYI
jgi:hypothetical protein